MQSSRRAQTIVTRADFPADFVWGTATSAYQIEGAVSEDGRGPSIWDTFARVPGAIADGSTGDVANDHYHRYLEDLDLVASLGVDAYRFSIAWPRIQADGTGPANPLGVDFYRRIVDACLQRGITPWATLYHWDLPQALEDRGGWLERDTAHRFAEFARLCAAGLGDVVTNWITLNEPHASAFAGYRGGVHAPGKRLGGVASRAAHHLLLGHGMAMVELRASDHDTFAGITLDITPARPATDRPEDVEAARRYGGGNRFFIEGLLGDGYPDWVLEDYGQADWFANNPEGDAALIQQPMDFIGVNYYLRHTVKAPSPGSTELGEVVDGGTPRTQMDWPIEPDGLIEAVRMSHELAPELPIYITENGSAWPDVVLEDGSIDDADREAYLIAHLEATAEAIRRGVPVRGYFAWSFMDNFEWQFGYSRRFGLAYVDYETQRRTLKRSGLWFADFLGANA